MVISKKQIRILGTALHLFAERGIKTTPTSLIAKEAGVSHGLLFHYYRSKANLLEEVIKVGYQRITDRHSAVVKVDAFSELIFRVLDMPRKLVEEERDFWRLRFRLAGEEVAQKHHARFLRSMVQQLVEAFERIGSQEPELEAEVLLLLVDELWRLYLTGGDKERYDQLICLLKKKHATKQEPVS